MCHKLSSMIFSLALLLSAGVAQAVTIETVSVGNPGNADDTYGDGYGGVGYEYRIGQFEVTNAQYCEFLTAVASNTDTYGLYNSSMGSSTLSCKIQQTPVSGGYTYFVPLDDANRPVNYVSFWDASRFTNWLHNGQPSGLQGPDTTERGAYTLDGYKGSDGSTIAKNSAAQWWIPSEDEWYKAAYHKNDGSTGNYWYYPTKTALGTPPGRDMAELTNPSNNANFDYNGTPYPIDGPDYTTVKGEFELSDSAYHTFDQAGNVWEWNDTVILQGSGFSTRGFRGGSFYNAEINMSAVSRPHISPTNELYYLGFRVASVPEPGSLTFLLCGAIALLAYAWRRRRT